MKVYDCEQRFDPTEQKFASFDIEARMKKNVKQVCFEQAIEHLAEIIDSGESYNLMYTEEKVSDGPFMKIRGKVFIEESH